MVAAAATPLSYHERAVRRVGIHARQAAKQARMWAWTGERACEADEKRGKKHNEFDQENHGDTHDAENHGLDWAVWYWMA